MTWNHITNYAISLSTKAYMRALVVIAAGVIGSGYLLTHPFPSGAGGFFLQTIEQISAEGSLPERIHHYTDGGVPFAYPPFAFVAYAAVHRVFDVSLIALARVMPVLGTIALGLAVFEFVHRVYDGQHAAIAGASAVFVVSSPDVLVWNLSAGGMVRSWALALGLVSLLLGLRSLRGDGSTLSSGIAFGLVLLSHPQTAAFTAIGHIITVLVYDPSRQGLLKGVSIGLVGSVVASPWLVHTVVTFGPEVLLYAAGSHSDEWVLKPLLSLLFDTKAPVVDLWRAFAFVGALVLVAERDWYLPALFGTTVLLLGTPRLMMTTGGMLAGAVVMRLDETVSPKAAVRLATGYRLDVGSVVVGLVLLYLVVGGGLYATGVTSESIPQYADEGDAETMAWLQTHSDSTATVMTLGDTAEWTPYLSQRTHLFTPWGAEWEGEYDRNARILLWGVSDCADATCVTRTLERANDHPEYMYVPKNGHSHGRPEGWGRLRRSLAASSTYPEVHETSAGVIYEVRWESRPGSDTDGSVVEPTGMDRSRSAVGTRASIDDESDSRDEPGWFDGVGADGDVVNSDARRFEREHDGFSTDDARQSRNRSPDTHDPKSPRRTGT